MRLALLLALVAIVAPPDAGAQQRLSSRRLSVGNATSAVFSPAVVERAIVDHLKTARIESAVRSQGQSTVPRRSWCQRRAAACGALIGLGAGYGLGFALGANPFIDDYVPSADALIVGAIGAAAGGTVGAVLQK